MMNQLRDFLYLDSSRMTSFISQIQGGQVDQIEETIKRQGGGALELGATLPFTLSANAQIGKHKESEQRRTIQVTEPVLFAALEDYLKAQSMLKDLEDISAGTVISGEFVTGRSVAEPPAVEHWIARLKVLVDFMDKHWKTIMPAQSRKASRGQKPPSKHEIEAFKGMVSFLEDMIHLGQADSRKQFVRMSNHQLETWSALIPEYILVPLDAILPTEVTVLGRVDKVLKEGETVKMIDFSTMNQSLDMEKLLELLNALAPFIGQRPLTDRDLQANYPGIFITPVAIYR